MASKEGDRKGQKCSCCVLNCKGNARRNPELSFHQIPKRLELRKAWIHAIQSYIEPGPLFKISPHTVVCSRHFKKDDFKWAPVMKRLLKRDSVPSIFDQQFDDKPAPQEILKYPVPEKMQRFATAGNDNRDSTENFNGGPGNYNRDSTENFNGGPGNDNGDSTENFNGGPENSSTGSGYRGGRRCVAGGCSSMRTSTNRISLHEFPLNRPDILRQWINFVRETRCDWKGPSKCTVLCSLHFTEECYPAKFRLMDSMGMKFKNRTLEWDAVPTIQAAIFSQLPRKHYRKVNSQERSSSAPRRSLRLALQMWNADETSSKTKVIRDRKKLVVERLRKSSRRRKEAVDQRSVLSKPSDTSYAVYIDNPEEQPSDVSATTHQVALSRWNSGIDVCEDLKPIVLNPVTSTTEENGCTMSFPQNQDVFSGGKCVENRPDFVHVKREPECSFIESEPEYIYVKSEPECSYVKSEPECIDVKSEPSECTYVKTEPECSYVKSEPECLHVKSEAECIDDVKNESENTWVLVKTMIGNQQTSRMSGFESRSDREGVYFLVLSPS